MNKKTEMTSRTEMALEKTIPDILDFADPQTEYQRLWHALCQIALNGAGNARYHAQQTILDTPDGE